MSKGYIPPFAAHMRRAAAVMLPEDIDDFFARIADGRYQTVVDTLDTFAWLLEHKDRNTQSTPLIIAARNGQLAAVQFLKERGADMEATDAAGMTALMNACAKGEGAIAVYLAENGARAGRVNASGMSAASCAYGADFPALADTMKRYAEQDRESTKAAWRAAADKISEGTHTDVPLMKRIKLRGNKPD